MSISRATEHIAYAVTDLVREIKKVDDPKAENNTDLDAAVGILLFVARALDRRDKADEHALSYIEKQCDQLAELRDLATPPPEQV